MTCIVKTTDIMDRLYPLRWWNYDQPKLTPVDLGDDPISMLYLELTKCKPDSQHDYEIDRTVDNPECRRVLSNQELWENAHRTISEDPYPVVRGILKFLSASESLPQGGPDDNLTCDAWYEHYIRENRNELDHEIIRAIAGNAALLRYVKAGIQLHNTEERLPERVQGFSMGPSAVMRVMEKNSPFFVSFASDIRSHDNEGNERLFSLGRVKTNITALYTTRRYVDGTPRLSGIDIPGEVVDISITRANRHIYADVLDSIEEYELEGMDGRKINSYSVKGYIGDLMRILYKESVRPWDIKKYNKYLMRLMVLLVMQTFKTIQRTMLPKRIIVPLRKRIEIFEEFREKVFIEKEVRHGTLETLIEKMTEVVPKISSKEIQTFIEQTMMLSQLLLRRRELVYGVQGRESPYVKYLDRVSDVLHKLMEIFEVQAQALRKSNTVIPDDSLNVLKPRRHIN